MSIKQHSLNSTAGPLMCWDIFMEGYYRKMELSDDLTSLKKLSKDMGWIGKMDFSDALFKYGNTIIVTDNALKIVYASSAITSMNGYTPREVIGFSPNMFQGPDTAPEFKMHVREAVIKQLPFEQTVTNYRKNGEPYICHIKGFAMFNAANKLMNYIAFEKLA